MKKLCILFAGALLLTSCMKKRTCECYDSSGKLVGSRSTTSTNKSSYEQLESDCDKSNTAAKQTGGYCTYK